MKRRLAKFAAFLLLVGGIALAPVTPCWLGAVVVVPSVDGEPFHDDPLEDIGRG